MKDYKPASCTLEKTHRRQQIKTSEPELKFGPEGKES